MRPLTEEELKIFFEKLSKYIGNGIKALVDRPDGRYCFRLHRDRVYYVGEHLVKHANALPRDQLVALGCTLAEITGVDCCQTSTCGLLSPLRVRTSLHVSRPKRRKRPGWTASSEQ